MRKASCCVLIAVPKGPQVSGPEAYRSLRESLSPAILLRGVAESIESKSGEQFDPRGAESYLTVRGAPRGEKTLQSAVHRRPQQKTRGICGLAPILTGNPYSRDGCTTKPIKNRCGAGVSPAQAGIN